MPSTRFTTKPAFDPVVDRCAPESLSFTEEEALQDSMWELGEDGHLREDIRFRKTSWRRWILSDRFLANEAVYRSFHRDGRSERAISEALQEIAGEMKRTCVFCPADPRFTVRDGVIYLSAAELSDQPRIEDATDLEKYRTHLPLHTLTAVAASEPAGEWGTRAQEEIIETLGWVKVDLPGRGMNDRMFVARIKGHSMDNGRSGLKDGSLAVFELWPKGRRSGRKVLMRGSFSDPDCGNYALKQYQGVDRDENRERTSIRLVSLNPDKARYPDILLTADDASSFEVVAELLSPLTPDQYGRAPKPERRKGQRDLTSEEGRQRMQQKLDQAVQKFFEAEPRQTASGDSEDRRGWSACLVCLDPETGSLHVETSQLSGFPSFVKTLHLTTGEFVQPVIAANLTGGIRRNAVPPSSAGYKWSAPGFDGVLDEDLARLSIDGLTTDRVTVFRVDADGVGRQLAGATLSPGQSYRIVLPPGMSVGVSTGDVVALGNAWHVWELMIPRQVSGDLVAVLESLRLEVTKALPCLDWIGTPVSRYATNAAGQTYPVFRTSEPPVLRVSGVSTRTDGELMLFVGGGGRFVSVALPAGDSWWVKLDGFAPGDYFAEAAHQRISVGRVSLPFRVADSPTVCPSCKAELLLGQDLLLPDAVGLIERESDLSAVFGGEPQKEFVLKGPRFRRVAAFWDDGKRRHIADLYLDESGTLDLAAECPRLADLVCSNPLGNLDMDLGELAMVRILHGKDISLGEILDKLRDLIAKKGTHAETLRGQYPHLRAMWLDPLLSLLYHGVRELEQEQVNGLPAESGAAVLLAEKLSREGKRIVRRPRRVIVIAPNESAVLNAREAGLWDLADQACRKTGLAEAVLTDGFVWSLHTVNRKVQPGTVDLREAVQEGRDGLFEAFLYSHAVTV
jgi:hypothetical protein